MSNCIEGNTTIFTWDGADFCFDDNVYCWDEVRLAQEVSSGGGGRGSYIESYNNLTPKKKDKFITLICKVEGHIETEATKKKIKANITAEQVKMITESVLNTIDVKIIK